MILKGIFYPLPLLHPAPWPAGDEQPPLLHAPDTIIFYLTTGTKHWSQPTLERNLGNCKPK
jgi:hypothetical protein